MIKYFIDTGYGVDGEAAWLIAEVHSVKDQGKLKVGEYGKTLINYYYSAPGANRTTGARRPWRFRDNAWECAALLIKMMFHDIFDPRGDEPWLKLHI